MSRRAPFDTLRHTTEEKNSNGNIIIILICCSFSSTNPTDCWMFAIAPQTSVMTEENITEGQVETLAILQHSLRFTGTRVSKDHDFKTSFVFVWVLWPAEEYVIIDCWLKTWLMQEVSQITQLWGWSMDQNLFAINK